LLYLWDTAEDLGIADRLTVLVASDFGRTPWYNEGNGKDHWPVGSALLMKYGASWGDRVIGLTDEGDDALAIDPVTLAQSSGGVVLTPSHVHTALRKIAGIDQHATARKYPFDVASVNLPV
jgi:uncharacterized protein (DUF1501 family)